MSLKAGTKVTQLRLPQELYDRVKILAGKKRWSVNSYIVNMLEVLTKPRQQEK